jgi:hypothetical protein
MAVEIAARLGEQPIRVRLACWLAQDFAALPRSGR